MVLTACFSEHNYERHVACKLGKDLSNIQALKVQVYVLECNLCQVRFEAIPIKGNLGSYLCATFKWTNEVTSQFWTIYHS